jgi:hypothetical protein
METLPLASVVPLSADKVDPMELGAGTNVKVTGKPPTTLFELSVTVAVMMLCSPATRDIVLAFMVMMYPGVAVEELVVPDRVMTTAP